MKHVIFDVSNIPASGGPAAAGTEEISMNRKHAADGSIRELSSSQEDYLEAVLGIVSRDKVARVRDIARRLKVGMPSVSVALRTLRENLASPAIEATLLPSRFTMPELQRLHEAILGRRLDRRNFQKRMLESGILERLPERRTGGAHRAPYLYRFKTGHAAVAN